MKLKNLLPGARQSARTVEQTASQAEECQTQRLIRRAAELRAATAGVPPGCKWPELSERAERDRAAACYVLAELQQLQAAVSAAREVGRGRVADAERELQQSELAIVAAQEKHTAHVTRKAAADARVHGVGPDGESPEVQARRELEAAVESGDAQLIEQAEDSVRQARRAAAKAEEDALPLRMVADSLAGLTATSGAAVTAAIAARNAAQDKLRGALNDAIALELDAAAIVHLERLLAYAQVARTVPPGLDIRFGTSRALREQAEALIGKFNGMSRFSVVQLADVEFARRVEAVAATPEGETVEAVQ